ncbi:MAG: pantoate--beta-alanine ligase [Bacillales bacterium]|jgi:pantoate--beta-alanine ligase|nr:pantoate--beta-alanine ligase [Bacillales bacterium]
MKVVRKISELRGLIQLEKNLGKKIGFVPTMGYLHEGHASLLSHARTENDVVILSIFVNPTQFGPNEDFDSYPRDFERDEKIASKEGVDYIFYPSVLEMYGDNATVSVVVKDRNDVLCGKSRPGHFDGVVTVVSKLFNIVNPSKAYFGKKDAQQLAIIQGLVRDLNFDIEIIGVDIKRELDGLALSSRNVRLSIEERENAPMLYECLKETRKMFEESNDLDNAIRSTKAKLMENQLGSLDYLEILSYPELKKPDKKTTTFIVAIAFRYSTVRLIDNIIFKKESEKMEIKNV